MSHDVSATTDRYRSMLPYYLFPRLAHHMLARAAIFVIGSKRKRDVRFSDRKCTSVLLLSIRVTGSENALFI